MYQSVCSVDAVEELSVMAREDQVLSPRKTSREDEENTVELSPRRKCSRWRRTQSDLRMSCLQLR